jgi:tetratricopeptide (TPR) repeat protein
MRGIKRPDNEPDAPFPAATAAASIAEPDYPDANASTNSIASYGLPPRNIKFTGREDMLSKIYKSFESSYRVSVTGAGGFGKTEAAVEYAYRHMPEYEHICYFNAESESRLQDVYREFAINEAGIKNIEGQDFPAIKRILYGWFKEHPSCLLIYDNAEGCPDLKEYLPQGQDQSRILINTRERLPGIIAENISAEVFSKGECFEFLAKRFPAIIKEDSNKLADALGGLPLALECAAAYMQETGRTPSQYLSLFEKHRIKALNQPSKSTEYKETIMTVWKATFDKISQEAEHDEETEAAMQLFMLCTYCAPDDIPLKLFIDGSGEMPQPLRSVLEKNDELVIDAIINKLTRYSIVSIRRTAVKPMLTVHRLLHEAAYDYFGRDKEWADCCLRIANSVLHYKYGTREEFDEFSANMPHVIEMTNHVEVLLMDDGSQKKIARIYNEIGYGLVKKGNYAEALAWYKKALTILEKVLSAEHPDTATAYNNIAGVYRNQGNYAEALVWHKKALAICEKVLGAEHPDTAMTYSNIAVVYDDQGDYAEALEWYKKALTIYEKVLGKEHPSTATAYNNIAGVYDNKGDYTEALAWYEKALAIREKVLGAEHPSTATTYNNIAGVYRGQGDYDEALAWFKKALAICEKVLGAEHPNTATIYNNIAGVYRNQGNYAEALAWYKKALAIRVKVLGAEHPDMATIYNNIAVVYDNQGDYAEALVWYKKALAIREKVLGAEHPSTAMTYNNMAGVYRNQGNYAEALAWYKKALAIYEKVLGKEHPFTATAYNNMALVYSDQGDYAEALAWHKKALTIKEKVLGAEHPSTATTYNNIAGVYSDQGDYAVALVWHKKALAIREKVFGAEHPITKDIIKAMESIQSQGENEN